MPGQPSASSCAVLEVCLEVQVVRVREQLDLGDPADVGYSAGRWRGFSSAAVGFQLKVVNRTEDRAPPLAVPPLTVIISYPMRTRCRGVG